MSAAARCQAFNVAYGGVSTASNVASCYYPLVRYVVDPCARATDAVPTRGMSIRCTIMAFDTPSKAMRMAGILYCTRSSAATALSNGN